VLDTSVIADHSSGFICLVPYIDGSSIDRRNGVALTSPQMVFGCVRYCVAGSRASA
jgi:hypothetical protein